MGVLCYYSCLRMIMLWLMLYQTYILLTGSLASRCSIRRCHGRAVLVSGNSLVAPPSLQTYLLLPGINPVIPIVYGIIGIVIAVVVHEGTHGVIPKECASRWLSVHWVSIFPNCPHMRVCEEMTRYPKAKFRQSGRVMAGGPGEQHSRRASCVSLAIASDRWTMSLQFNGVNIGGVVSPSPAFNLYTNHEIAPGD